MSAKEKQTVNIEKKTKHFTEGEKASFDFSDSNEWAVTGLQLETSRLEMSRPPASLDTFRTLNSDSSMFRNSREDLVECSSTSSIQQTDENMISSTSSTSASIFISLYDFHGVGEEQLSLKKGDQVRVLGFNKTGEWCEARLHATRKGGVGSQRRVGQIGWVPSNFISPFNSLDKYTWYHGKISRSESEYILGSGITGSFLVRESETSLGQFSISVRHEGRVYHYRINVDPNERLYITQEVKFKTLAELVHHHSIQSDGLICTLMYAASKKDKQRGVFSLSPTQPDEWEIDRREIIMHNKLGGGQYGDVYEGYWKRHECTIAVKALKEDAMPLHEFLAEASIMKDLNQKNLVRLLGVCTREAPFFIITEFMCKGNLLDYLRRSDKSLLPPVTLIHMASQVASGMAYLEARHFIHRDVAARNCLVGNENIVKIADFGLARFMREDTYTAQVGAKFPIKWTAPEGLAFNTFSSKSDVWAFGVLLWEIGTYGMTPYPNVELNHVYGILEQGYRMDAPVGCPVSVYRLMLQCWSWSPSDRPRFRDIFTNLESLVANNSAFEEEVSQQLKKTKESKRRSTTVKDRDRGNSRNSGYDKYGDSSHDMIHSISRNSNSDASEMTMSTFRDNGARSPLNLRTFAPAPPQVPNQNAKPKLLKSVLNSNAKQASVKNDAEIHEVTPLAEKNVRKSVTRYGGTMPKGQRIDAYLDSIRKSEASGWKESTDADNECAGSSSMSRTVSDDSLDALPLPDSMNSSSYGKIPAGENSFLQQIRSKLKKRSETPDQADSDTADESTNKSDNSVTPFGSVSKQTVVRNTMKESDPPSRASPAPTPPSRNSSVTLNSEAKASDQSPTETGSDASSWKTKQAVTRKIEVVRTDQPFNSVEGELKARIRNLRHVSKEEAMKMEDKLTVTPDSPPSDVQQSFPQPNSNEKSKVRQLVTQKVFPLQHHRPFSLQCPNNSNSSTALQSEHAETSGSSSSSILHHNKDKIEAFREVPSHFSTLQRFKTSEPEREKKTNGVEGMVRTQSLRNIANKFETPGTTTFGKAEDVVPYRENAIEKKNKRYSMLEGGRNDPLKQIIMARRSKVDEDSLEMDDEIVSKEMIVALSRLVDENVRACKANKIVPATSSSASAESNLQNLIRLSDTTQKFHSNCSIYAEQISPHSKFRFKELLSQLDNFNRQIRYPNSTSDFVEEKVLPHFEETFQHIMCLINR